MRNLRTVVSGLVLTLIFAAAAFPSTGQKDEKDAAETLIKAARSLEQNPLDNKAKDIRSKAVMWIIATDKVTVNICSLISSGVDKEYKYQSEVFGQYTIGMAAFKLANPSRASDEDAAQLAGVESALLSYESIIKAQPKSRNAFLDGLLAKRGEGQLAGFVKENNCTTQK
jgi:hypothetical protein